MFSIKVHKHDAFETLHDAVLQAARDVELIQLHTVYEARLVHFGDIGVCEAIELHETPKQRRDDRRGPREAHLRKKEEGGGGGGGEWGGRGGGEKGR